MQNNSGVAEQAIIINSTNDNISLTAVAHLNTNAVNVITNNAGAHTNAAVVNSNAAIVIAADENLDEFDDQLNIDVNISLTELQKPAASDESEEGIETCRSCSSLSSTSHTSIKRDDNETRSAFCDIPLHEFLKLKCNANTCAYGGACVNETTIGELEELRIKAWGGLTIDAPSAKARKNFIYDILEASYVKSMNKFQFIAGGTPGNYHLVCEAAYLILLGISKSRNASECSYQWKTAKRSVLGLEPEKLKMKLNQQPSLDSATVYIENMTEKLADSSPFAGHDKAQIIPYYDVTSVYNDYVRHQIAIEAVEDTVSIATFRRAFLLKKNIKLLGSKGAFHTCEICNNALDLLHDESKYIYIIYIQFII
jgi:hypothetical protein